MRISECFACNREFTDTRPVTGSIFSPDWVFPRRDVRLGSKKCGVRREFNGWAGAMEGFPCGARFEGGTVGTQTARTDNKLSVAPTASRNSLCLSVPTLTVFH